MSHAAAVGSIALGTVARRAEWLVIACGKCERKGRSRLSNLVAQYGADYPMTQLRRDLACPRLRPGVQLSRRVSSIEVASPSTFGAHE